MRSASCGLNSQLSLIDRTPRNGTQDLIKRSPQLVPGSTEGLAAGCCIWAALCPLRLGHSDSGALQRLYENGQLLSEKGRALARQAAFLDDPAVPCEMDVVRQKEAAQFGEDWDR
jgi:hypothetical protein